jgi:DNA repair protein RecN (Recombination protein N)
MGDQHFLVYKQGDVSHARELNFDDRVDEIARIISGESITQEARGFAKELLGLNKLLS